MLEAGVNIFEPSSLSANLSMRLFTDPQFVSEEWTTEKKFKAIA